MAVIRQRHLGTMNQEAAQRSADALNVEAPEGVLYKAQHRFANRWIVVRTEDDVCDYRCTQATGDECECHCSGVNHGRDAK